MSTSTYGALDIEESEQILPSPGGAIAKKPLTFHIHPETIRVVAYVNFWIMTGLAMILTRVLVYPYPYDVDNPLKQTFGYTNICINWDYAPVLFIIAMVYPFVEIPLLTYVAVFWARLYQDHLRGQTDYFYFGTVASAIEFILFMWFRMVFVVRAIDGSAYDSVLGHTLGFFGLQIGFVINSIKSFVYFVDSTDLTAKNWKFWAGVIYVTLTGLVTIFKLIYVAAIFAGHPLWTIGSEQATAVGQTLDSAWMVLVAILPLFFALYLRKNTHSLTLSLGWNPAA